MRLLRAKTVTETTVLDGGITATLTKTGFVSVDLPYTADPEGCPPHLMAAERDRLPAWRFHKEYDRDFGAAAGQPAFDQESLGKQRAHLHNAIARMDLDEDGKTLVPRDRGRVLIYLPPDEQPKDFKSDGIIEKVIRACAIGVDVGEGVKASDTSIEVFFADNKEQAAEMSDNQIHPAEAGRMAVAVAKFYNNGLIVPVRKMHGLTAIRAMIAVGYYHIWHQKLTDRIVERQTEKLGWGKGESSSELLFGRWQDAIAKEETILHSVACLQSHLQFIYDERGRICHQKLASLPAEVRERHGDRVVACALAFRGCMDLPKIQRVVVRKPTIIEQELIRRAGVKKQVWRRD